MMIRVTPKLCVSAAAALLFVSGSAVAQDGPTTTYKFGGYAKFDAMFSDYSDGTPSGSSLIRQFYVPSQIPVGDGSSSDDITADFQARETRINFRADTKTAGGDSITAFIEMDFFVHSDGNEVVSNSYSPRLRHAFIKYNKWTFGQTWSTFQDVAALPEALDFVGPAESTTFVRQAMVRYTTGGLELAVENPETFVAAPACLEPPFPADSCPVEDDDPPGPNVSGTRGLSTMPDLVGRYTFKFGEGSFIKLAGLVRNLKIQEDAGGGQADETAYGVSASAKFMFGGGGDLRAMVTYGDGVGRYLGLGFVPDGYLNADGTIALAEALGYYVSLRLPLGSKLRTNIMYGSTSIDYDNDALAAGLNDTASSIHWNLIYNILPKLDVGAEIMYAERELVSGTDGDFTRFIVSAKYAF